MIRQGKAERAPADFPFDPWLCATRLSGILGGNRGWEGAQQDYSRSIHLPYRGNSAKYRRIEGVILPSALILKLKKKNLVT